MCVAPSDDPKMFVVVLLVLLLPVFGIEQSKLHGDTFHEELFIKQLPSGHVYSYFQFTTWWKNDVDQESYAHSHLFPQTLAEILKHYEVQEMHLSLTSGLWRHENWGYPIVSAPPGAELWAWFDEKTEDVDRSWTLFASSLSGLFCASLNFINPQQSVSPKYSFPPLGAYETHPHNRSFVRYSSLPREIVCTENLTPFKKLLPCDSKKGLASLLNAGHIHNANYHSLGVHVRPHCVDKDCQEVQLELRQTVSLVYDLIVLGQESKDWSFRKLFGIGLSGSCPLATSSNIYVDLSLNESSTFQLSPTPTKVITSVRGGYSSNLAVFDMKQTSVSYMFNIACSHTGPRIFSVISPPVLHATRHIVGYGQERGGIATKIYNHHWKEIQIIYFENIPWFIPIYYHTLKVTTNLGSTLQPYASHYFPGRERKRPYTVELLLSLPPRSTSEISVEFDYNFLKWQEYPPDANHGFYVGSAVITALLPHTKNYTSIPVDGSTFSSSFNASRDGYPVTLHTEILLVTLPTPDFSMPYNVICLACTVVAFAFGPLHNFTTKMLALKAVEDSKGVLGTLKERLTNLLKKKDTSSSQMSDTLQASDHHQEVSQAAVQKRKGKVKQTECATSDSPSKQD